MSPRALLVLLSLGISIFVALISGKEIFYNIAYLLTGLLTVSFLWSRTSLLGIEIERQRRSNRAQVGQLFIERFLLRNANRLPKLWVEITDTSELPGHKVSGITTQFKRPREWNDRSSEAVVVNAGVRPRGIRTWISRTLCTRRGRYRLGPLTIRSADPFNLFPRSMLLPNQQNLIVLPMTVGISEFPVPSGRLPGGDALRRRTHQITPNAAGVRDYVPGDSLKRIHWLSTARRGRLIAKEFELDPLAEIWLVLDACRAEQHHTKEPERPEDTDFTTGFRFQLPLSTDEYAVSATASLILHFLAQDRAVGLIAQGDSRLVTQPETGDAQSLRLLESLAVLRAIGDLPLEDLIKVEGPQIARGSTVIVVTPSIRTEILDAIRSLQYTGCRVVLVLLDSASFGGPQGSSAIASAAERSGIPVRSIPAGVPLEVSLGGGPNQLPRRMAA